MKYVKMLGLAAVAAMALMAFVANSASATTLTSPKGTFLPKGTTILANLTGSAELLSTSGETLDTCTAGSVHAVTDQETGPEITGTAAVGWGAPGTECTKTTDTLKGGTIGIAHSTGINGTVKSFNAEVTVFTLGLSCIYGTAATGTTQCHGGKEGRGVPLSADPNLEGELHSYKTKPAACR